MGGEGRGGGEGREGGREGYHLHLHMAFGISRSRLKQFKICSLTKSVLCCFVN